MMYQLLSGKYPFMNKDERQMFDDICNEKVSFHHAPFRHVPKSATDLIRLMLDKDAGTRIKAQDCLDHPFFTESLTKD